MIEINECRETTIYRVDEDICIKQFSEDCQQSVTVYIPLDRAQDVAAAIITTLLESPVDGNKSRKKTAELMKYAESCLEVRPAPEIDLPDQHSLFFDTAGFKFFIDDYANEQHAIRCKSIWAAALIDFIQGAPK